MDYSGNTTTGGTGRLVQDPTDPSRLCLELENTCPGPRPLSDGQRTKLWDVADTGWAQDYQVEEAYYYGEVYFPQPYIDGSNIIQWGHWAPTHGSMPEAKIIIDSDNHLYYKNKVNEAGRHDLGEVPFGEWISICVYLKTSSTYWAVDGEARVWVNGVEKWYDSAHQGRSKTADHYMFVWSINNYSTAYEPQGTHLYWRNVKVTSEYPDGF